MSSLPHTFKKSPGKSGTYATKVPKKPKSACKPDAKRAKRPKKQAAACKMKAKRAAPSPQLTKAQAKALQREWYAKLKASGFDDLEVIDRNGDPAAHIPLKGRAACTYQAPELQARGRFFMALRNFVTHCPRFSRDAVVQVACTWYADGLTTSEIVDKLNKGRRVRFKDPSFTKSGRMVDAKRGVELNLYSLHYILKEFVRRAIKWNKMHPEGIWFEPDLDFGDSVER